MTGETITDPAALEAQLDVVRRTGIATEVEEAVLGECGLAAPLGDSSDEVVGAIGLVVPAGDWPLDQFTRDVLGDAALAVVARAGRPAPAPAHRLR